MARAKRLQSELTRSDPYWPAQVAVLGALVLYLLLPNKLTVGPEWLVPSAEGALLIGLILSTPRSGRGEQPRRRVLAIVLVGVVSATNVVSLALLVHFISTTGKGGGYQLVLSGAEIWITNILMFALWYWELDRGGPAARRSEQPGPADFQFPQMTMDDERWRHWSPNFIDYLYTSFTNSTAFSPTDTMPLTSWAKLLMLVQGLAALTTVVLVVARAVGAFGG